MWIKIEPSRINPKWSDLIMNIKLVKIQLNFLSKHLLLFCIIRIWIQIISLLHLIKNNYFDINW